MPTKFDPRSDFVANSPPNKRLLLLLDATKECLNHLNQQHQRIKFTIEHQKDGKLPYLDTCVRIKVGGTFSMKVYRKKTHTNQYLNFNSNNHLS